jgi:hypothetical protein
MSGDELGEKPSPINAAEILIESEPVGASGKKSGSQEGWEDQPFIDIAQDNVETVSPVDMNPREARKDVMAGSFNPNATVPEYIRGTMEQLNGIQKYFHGRDVQKLSRGQVLKITRELFEYQYKDMQHLLTLGMDVQKKTRFLQYMNATKNLQNKIQRESAEAQATVIATMFDNRVDAYKAKNKRDADFEKMYRQGVIDKKQYEQSIKDNERLADEQIHRLNETQKLLIVRHTEFLHHTLELFKAEAISQGVI